MPWRMVNTYPSFITTDYLSWSDVQSQIQNVVYRGDLHLFRRWVGREFSGLWSEVFQVGAACWWAKPTFRSWVCLQWQFKMRNSPWGADIVEFLPEFSPLRQRDTLTKEECLPILNAAKWYSCDGNWHETDCSRFSMSYIAFLSYTEKISGFPFRMDCCIIFRCQPQKIAISFTPI